MEDIDSMENEGLLNQVPVEDSEENALDRPIKIEADNSLPVDFSDSKFFDIPTYIKLKCRYKGTYITPTGGRQKFIIYLFICSPHTSFYSSQIHMFIVWDHKISCLFYL